MVQQQDQDVVELLKRMPFSLQGSPNINRQLVYHSDFIWCELVDNPKRPLMLHVHKLKELLQRLRLWASRPPDKKLPAHKKAMLTRWSQMVDKQFVKAISAWKKCPWRKPDELLGKAFVDLGLDVLQPTFGYDPLPDSIWISFNRLPSGHVPTDKLVRLCEMLDEFFHRQDLGWKKAANLSQEVLTWYFQNDPKTADEVFSLLESASAGPNGLRRSSISQ